MSIRSASPHVRTTHTAIAALVAAAACWGLGTVASKQVVDDVAPLTLLPIQLAAGCILLLGISLARHEQFWECVRCGKAFWHGSHWDRIAERLRQAGPGDARGKVQESDA